MKNVNPASTLFGTVNATQTNQEERLRRSEYRPEV